MPTVKIKNTSGQTMRYTVTVMAGQPDCTGNEGTVETVDLNSGGSATISISEPSIKSIATSSERVTA